MIEYVKLFIAWYALIWALPGSITGILLAFGSEERIIWLDLQLAKNAKDLHSNQQCMTSYSIFSRYIDYCVMYPVIRHRANEKSSKFELFMWMNAIGIWSWMIAFIFAVITKLL